VRVRVSTYATSVSTADVSPTIMLIVDTLKNMLANETPAKTTVASPYLMRKKKVRVGVGVRVGVRARARWEGKVKKGRKSLVKATGKGKDDE